MDSDTSSSLCLRLDSDDNDAFDENSVGSDTASGVSEPKVQLDEPSIHSYDACVKVSEVLSLDEDSTEATVPEGNIFQGVKTQNMNVTEKPQTADHEGFLSEEWCHISTKFYSFKQHPKFFRYVQLSYENSRYRAEKLRAFTSLLAIEQKQQTLNNKVSSCIFMSEDDGFANSPPSDPDKEIPVSPVASKKQSFEGLSAEEMMSYLEAPLISNLLKNLLVFDPNVHNISDLCNGGVEAISIRNKLMVYITILTGRRSRDIARMKVEEFENVMIYKSGWRSFTIYDDKKKKEQCYIHMKELEYKATENYIKFVVPIINEIQQKSRLAKDIFIAKRGRVKLSGAHIEDLTVRYVFPSSDGGKLDLTSFGKSCNSTYNNVIGCTEGEVKKSVNPTIIRKSIRCLKDEINQDEVEKHLPDLELKFKQAKWEHYNLLESAKQSLDEARIFDLVWTRKIVLRQSRIFGTETPKNIQPSLEDEGEPGKLSIEKIPSEKPINKDKKALRKTTGRGFPLFSPRKDFYIVNQEEQSIKNKKPQIPQ